MLIYHFIQIHIVLIYKLHLNILIIKFIQSIFYEGKKISVTVTTSLEIISTVTLFYEKS